MPSVSVLLKSKLPIQKRTPTGHWRCATPAEADRAEGWTHAIDDPSRLSPKALLKQGRRRLVFRDGPHVIKAFPLEGLRRWTGRSHYALTECQNLLEAARRGLAVPACRGYGEAASLLTGCRWNAAVMTHLPGRTLRDQWLAEPDDIDLEASLDLVTPLAVQLYEKGINHIDFGPHAVLLSDGRPHVIDWQYAHFLSAPDHVVFAGQIGYFAWATATNRAWATAERMRAWFEALWEKHDIPERERCRDVFESCLVRRRSITERLEATPVRGRA